MLRLVAHQVLRGVARVLLRTVAIPRFGGATVAGANCRVYYVGRMQRDWTAVAMECDELLTRLTRRVTEDFGLRQRSCSGVLVVIISAPPGIAGVARVLRSGDPNPRVENGTYLAPERAVLVRWKAEPWERRIALAWALFDDVRYFQLGALYGPESIVYAYARLVTCDVVGLGDRLDPGDVDHFLRVHAGDGCFLLEEALTTDYTEPSLGPRAFNEQLACWLWFLRSHRREWPEAWRFVGTILAGEVTVLHDTRPRWEAALGKRVSAIEPEFVKWCEARISEMPIP